MTTAEAGVVGAAPRVTITERTEEQAKYERMWQHRQYRAVAPGEDAAMTFLRQAQLKPGAEVIDFGAGTGRGAALISQLGARVHMLDFASNCLDDEVRAMVGAARARIAASARLVITGDELSIGYPKDGPSLQFTQHDLTKPSPVQAEYGYCTDVMEHLPPDQVDRVLVNILQAAQHVFFQISCVDDALGALIGQPLHLTVQPYEWWHRKLQSLDCVIHWSRNDGHQALFYVTAWQDARKVVEIGALNIGEAQILANVKANVAAGWQQVEPHLTNDAEIMILGGGPSLGEFEYPIRVLRESGAKLITLNGAYNWAIEHGLKPSAQIVVDARPFNARFTRQIVPGCKYLIASQCDPSVLEGLPRDLTYLWHTTAEQIKPELDAAYPVWWVVPGGSTVMLRAIPLLRMLGFKRMHLFGFDSCLSGDAHHAYTQSENDSDVVIPVTVGGRTFRCHAWQAAQAQEFMDLVKFLGDEIELEVYGDGLINHILRTGAQLSDEGN